MVTQERKPFRLNPFWVGAWAALAFTTAARADFVTPDSIPQPPPAIGSANQTPIPSASDLVTSQYIGDGLLFPLSPNAGPPGATINTTFGTAAVANLAGSHVWAPALTSTDGFHILRELDYSFAMTLQFVRPGETTPATVSSVTINVFHLPNTLPIQLLALDSHGNILGDTDVASGTGPDEAELLTVSAAGISSFEVSYDASVADGAPRQEVPWGVAGIEFTPYPAAAPEPGALALAGIGAAALAGWMWRRRRNMPAFAA